MIKPLKVLYRHDTKRNNLGNYLFPGINGKFDLFAKKNEEKVIFFVLSIYSRCRWNSYNKKYDVDENWKMANNGYMHTHHWPIMPKKFFDTLCILLFSISFIWQNDWITARQDDLLIVKWLICVDHYQSDGPHERMSKCRRDLDKWWQ